MNWINALGGTPLLCLHKALDPKLVKALEQDVVPHLLQLGVVPEAAPDLTQPPVRRRSPWCSTARAGAQTCSSGWPGAASPASPGTRTSRASWPEEDFHPLRGTDPWPAGTSATTVDLAEKPIVLRNGLTVRQIRRRLATGRQVPVITTHPQMPLEQVAGSMFSRWSQENFFKYLREQFNLDSLPTHDLDPIDPDAQVVNPVRRALEPSGRYAAACQRPAIASPWH